MATEKLSYKDRWEAMAPGRRRKVMTIVVMAGILLLAWMALGGSEGKKKAENPDAKAIVANALLPGGDARDIGVNGISDDVNSLRTDARQKDQKIAQLESQIAESRRQEAGSGSTITTRKMAEDLKAIHLELAQVKNSQANPVAPVQRGPNGVAVPPQGNVNQAPPTVTRSAGAIREIRQDVPVEAPPPVVDVKSPAGSVIPTMYLPSGSILTGVNITGVDAATGKEAMANPIPMLVRVKHSAILPNRYRADVRECFVLASGYGDLASERAYMRASSISCVRTDKRVIDIKVEMIAIGPDGKAGIRGRLVSRQGQIIAKAALAGLAQGLSQAFGGGQNQNQYLIPGTMPSASDVGAQAFGGGVGSAFDSIAKYYLKLADQMFPVVEIDPGQRITFVMTRGTSMGILK